MIGRRKVTRSSLISRVIFSKVKRDTRRYPAVFLYTISKISYLAQGSAFNGHWKKLSLRLLAYEVRSASD
jgi:hypothetical protein